MALKQSLLALFGIILPCFLGVAVDAKCCKPDRYSTFGISTDYKSSGAVVRMNANFYYDGILQRAAMEPLDRSYKVMCNLNTKRCSVYQLNGYYCQRLEGVYVPNLLPSGCIEDVLTFVGNRTIGVPPNSFTAKEYTGYMNSRQMSILVGSEQPCVPLMSNSWGYQDRPDKGMTNLVWTNVRLNEVPEDAFDIPESCLGAGKRSRPVLDQMPDIPLPLPFFGL